ncbi:MAG: nucleotidyl transferase AbiEii/AbiGii toxin family protein [Chloroflexi bacterium]|nr:nucleotidyl transferase AbiEii/AbiGii toxin family protein [Chloroflexota bacterium]MCY3695896.1 nucleotidyl transferase AbiEii/AbiGii toxin family protein [Chloroflexota bacterium]
MTEVAFDTLSSADQADALEVAAGLLGRPTYLLEKDLWVVYSLQALLRTEFADDLTFKGGTSLSKGYDVIRRFSEDVDITYDIGAIAPDLSAMTGDEVLPDTPSQANKWSKRIRKRVEDWAATEILPVIAGELQRLSTFAAIRAERDSLHVEYQPLFEGSDFVRPEVRIEFGARSTGEPRERRAISCDADRAMPKLTFPVVRPMVMRPERTFWEKATAVHVFCVNTGKGGDRLSRHWYDLVRLDESEFATLALDDRQLAEQVARLKNTFFREKDDGGAWIDFREVVSGSLHLVPDGDRGEIIADDYDKMVASGMLPPDAEPFDVLMSKCGDLERRSNTLVNKT